MNYELTISSAQIKEIAKSVELLMRLKLGQYRELTYSLCDIFKEPTEKLDSIDAVLKTAFEIINKDKKPTDYKDDEWYILYDIYQVLRKALHDTEHPEGQGVDSYEPLQLSTEPLPKCKWNKKRGGKSHP